MKKAVIQSFGEAVKVMNFSFLGPLPSDPPLQADASARHRADVPGRQLGLLGLVVLPQRVRAQEHLRARAGGEQW